MLRILLAPGTYSEISQTLQMENIRKTVKQQKAIKYCFNCLFPSPSHGNISI